MITTIVDLILKAVPILRSEGTRFSEVKRDQADRVADYLQRISEGLATAAEKATKGDMFYAETMEMTRKTEQLLNIVGDAFHDETFATHLHIELKEVVGSERVLLGGSFMRTHLDFLAIRPKEYMGMWDGNPLAKVSEAELKNLWMREVRKLNEASGLFRAAADELRARPVK